MKKQLSFILIFLFSSLTILQGFSQDSIVKAEKTKVYKFDIKEDIAPPAWRKTKLAFEQAKELNADIILIHMNTYGGAVNDADSIRTIILNSKIPVYVFIDNNAASAGALISIACDSIYMRPGGNIGAATVVNQTGEQMPDKYQSYMRSMMRSTAETNNRDPKIAESMVDDRIYIPGIIDSGKVLTFTTNEAMLNNFCEGSAENIREVLNLLNIEDYVIVEQKLTATDKIIDLLITPALSGILIMVIVGGIYFELQSPGVGFPIAASILAAILYFAPLYLEGLAANWEIIIFFLGIILVAVEIFVIPGFGIAGVLGAIFILGGLTLSLVENPGTMPDGEGVITILRSFAIVSASSVLGIIGSIWLSQKLIASNSFLGGMALNATQDKEDGFTSADSTYSIMLHKTGIAHTDLRPAGKVMINGDVFDAKSEIGFISKGEEIIVRSYEASQLFVIKT